MNLSLIEDAIYEHFSAKGFRLQVKDPFLFEVLNEYYVVCIVQKTSFDNAEMDYFYVFYSLKNNCVLENSKTVSWMAFLPSLQTLKTIDKFGKFEERQLLKQKFNLIIQNIGREDMSEKYKEYLVQSKEYKTEVAKIIYDSFLCLVKSEN